MTLRCLSRVTLFLLVALAASAQGVCNLSGHWRSAHGTLLEINLTDNGTLTGSYQSSSSLPKFTMVGVHQHGNQPTFALAVKDSTSVSVRVLSGQCYTTPDGGMTLVTLWILRAPAAKQTDDWQTSRIGAATFMRN
ncbi:avidin-related protein 1-like [Ambystoma mexicanum]|uniref:avidin-related protein 1-like n=1 Tax=Ambystoma mexicanum TaxID=8296 RepID=UPI0037E94303